MYIEDYDHYHFQKMDFITDNKWGFPIIKKEDKFDVTRLHQFGDNKGYVGTAHFFLYDYMFDRVWNNPNKYLGMLKKYDGTLSPDFSLFTDYPLAIQIYSTYKNRWCGRYWQENGIHVIPTVSWSTEESYEFCFEGLEKGTQVALSTMGVMREYETKRLFLNGFEEMMKRVEPSKIILYGKLPKEIENLNIKVIEPFYNKYKGMEYNDWE